MSCNGCRVLRKGCREECMLRDSLVWIESPQAQANATVFVAKFFGRATLMSFLSSVPPNQRSALFESLLYEAVGRRINPVSGAVGLLWSGKWKLCQMGVEKVLMRSAAAAAYDDSTNIIDTSSGVEEGGFDQSLAVPPPPPPAPSNSTSRMIIDDDINYEPAAAAVTHDDHYAEKRNLLTLFL